MAASDFGLTFILVGAAALFCRISTRVTTAPG